MDNKYVRTVLKTELKKAKSKATDGQTMSREERKQQIQSRQEFT